jgi:DNA-binding transcriptional ArsR family regulator
VDEHTFVPERRIALDWRSIRRHYDAGYTRRECQEKFGFSNGAWQRAVDRGDVDPRLKSTGVRASEKRERVAKLIAEGMSYSKISKELGLTKPTVAYHARRLGIPVDEKASRRYDWPAIQKAYNSGLSVRACARQFGFCTASWNAAVRRGAVVARPTEMPLERLLVVGRAQTNRSHLKGRLLKAGLKENRCEECGVTEWRGRPLSMQLHHVNGDGQDNRLENIILLCGNCHSQTDTYGGRNGHRRKRAA